MPQDLDGLKEALADRYTVERELGRGGMATVYLADDLEHRRPVAIKILNPALAAALGPNRFLQEIEVTAGLDHPHILPLYDSGRIDGSTDRRIEPAGNASVDPSSRRSIDLLYYVMPYVEGESLRTCLDREKQLPLEDALRLTREVAEGLAYAHSRGVIHRDIKPGNILLEGGRAVIADFGLARAVTQAGGERLTSAGISVGTPAYMSPEQAFGSEQLDGRSDLYSLGCVLYEMLVGHPPFMGTTARELLARHATDPVPSLRAVRTTIPEPVESAVLKALEKTPADRHATVQQFAEALSIDTKAYERRRRALGRVRKSAVGLLVAALLSAAAFTVVRHRAAPGWKRSVLDSNGLVVMPFRITATDPAIQTLDEGVIDLLYPVFDGDAGLRAVEPNPLLLKLREEERAGRAEAADLPLRLAAHFRAALLMEGSAIQAGQRLTLNGWLRRVPGGEVLARHTVRGAVDSAHHLVEQLGTALASQRLGEHPERVAFFSRFQTDAVAAYLAGMRAYRAARYADAVRHFTRSLQADSGFVLPALALSQAGMWTPARYQVTWPAVRRAMALRHTVGRREQAAITAQAVLQRVDTVATFADMLTALRNWIAVAPDEPFAWRWYAHALVAGPALQIPSWRDDFRHAALRAWALDSTTPAAVEELLTFAAHAEDAELVGRFGPRYLAVADTASDYWIPYRWLVAAVAGDSAMLRRLGARAEAGDPAVLTSAVLNSITLTEYMLRRPPVQSDLIAAHLRAGGLQADDSANFAYWFGIRQLERGQLASFRDLLAGPLGRFWNGRKGRWTFVIDFWLMYPGLDAVASVAAESIRVFASMPGSPPGFLGVGVGQPEYQRCYIQLYRAARGDTVGVRSAVGALEPWFHEHNQVGVCPALAEALVEARDTARGDTPALDRLEALLRRGPFWEFPTNAALPLLARLLRSRGQYDRALAAARMQGPVDWGLSRQGRVARLKEEGDLAVLVGDRPGAIEAYTKYLVLRSDPDELTRAEVDSVRAALEALLGAKG